jgi:hypothetical protein
VDYFSKNATMILTFDSVDGPGKQIESPTFVDIENAILSLDGSSRTQVGMFFDEDTFVQVGGGSDLCKCSIRANGKLYVLIDPSLTENEYVWVVDGQGDEIPRNECFKATDVVRVVKLFWDKRRLSDEFAWKTF